MHDLLSNYCREDAVADGVLIDATEQAASVGLLAPTFISAGLWNGPDIDRQPERVAAMLDLGPLRHCVRHRRFGNYAAPIVARCFSGPFCVYFELEPSREHGVVVTVLAESERLRYDMPRTGAGGSFYVT
jgi:hypothetical protein